MGSRSQFSALEARTLYSADLGLAGALPNSESAMLLPAEVGRPGSIQGIGLGTQTARSDQVRPENSQPGLGTEDLSELSKIASGMDDSAESGTLEVVLIDSRVPDIAALRADLQHQIDRGRNLAVMLIDSQSDGVKRATQMLALAGQPVSAVHIISHGESGALTLGSSLINSQSIERRSAELALWSHYLSADADVLLYGCNLAADAASEHMMTRLGEITGADIAASRDLTGARDLGGNWDLEYRSGKIETFNVTSTELQEHWESILSSQTSGLLPVNAAIPGTQFLAPFQESGRNVAVNDQGDIAVTWVDMNSDKVMVRLFHPDGSARTGDIAVVARNLSNPGELWQYNPIVAVREDGSFIVSWVEKHNNGNDKLYAQRFTAEGVNLGQVIDVTGGSSYQALQRPDIDVDSAGNFYIVYEVYDGVKNHVHVSGFKGNGEVRFTDQMVGKAASLFDGEASIAVKPDDGSFVISWTMQEPIGSSYEIAAQRFDANGTVVTTKGNATSSPWSDVLWVNSTKLGAQYQSSVAMADNGEFTVSFISNSLTGNIFSGYTVVGSDVLMRQFNNDDTPSANDVTVQTGGSKPWNSFSSVAVDSNNNPVIVWQQSATSLTDGFANASILAWSASGGYGYQSGTSDLAAGSGTTYTMPRVAGNGNIIVTAFTNIGTGNYSYGFNSTTNKYEYTTYYANASSPVQDLSMVVHQSNVSEYLAIAPTHIIPGPQYILEDNGPLAFSLSSGNAIQIGDSDANNNLLRVTVSLPSGTGQLQISDASTVFNPATPGIRYAGAISGTSLVLEGTVAELNLALAKLVYAPASNFNGSVALDINTTELYGSPPISVSAQVAIVVAAVNDAPSGSDQSKTILEDTGYIFAALDFALSDSSDSPSHQLSAVKITSLPTQGSLTLSGALVSVNQIITISQITSNLLVFTPDPNANGTNYSSLGFQVIDNGGTANGGQNTDPVSRNFTFTVTAVNDAPSADDQTRTILEDTNFIFQSNDFGFSDSADTVANTLAGITVTSLPGVGSLSLLGAPVTPNQFVSAGDISSGKLRYTPAPNSHGAAYAGFTFLVKDNGGTSNGGVDTAPSAQLFSFNVTSVNDAPSGASQVRTILEDTSHTFAISDFGFSDASDSPSNSLLGITITSLPTAGSLKVAGSAVTLNQTIGSTDILAGRLVFTPDLNANGTAYASFGFRVLDNGGTANGGLHSDLIPRSFAFDVFPASDSPSIQLGPMSISEGGKTIITAAMIAAEDPDNHPASSLVFTVNSASEGQFEFGASPGQAITSFTQEDINFGKVSFSHYGSEFSPNFSLSVTDGTSVVNAAAPVVNFIGVNDTPVIASQQLSISVTEEAIYILGIDSNTAIVISDPDAGSGVMQLTLNVPDATLTLANLTGITFSAGANTSTYMVIQGRLADLNAALNGLYIQPVALFKGTTALSISVDDQGNSGAGGSRQANLSLPITVLAVADAPAGANLSRSLAENTYYTIGLADFGFSDADDTPANTFTGVRITALPSAGSLTLAGAPVSVSQVISVAQINAGDLLFEPAQNANGLNYANLEFQVMDSGSTSNGGVNIDPSANVLSFDVTPVNNAPLISVSNTVATMDEDSVLVFSTASGNAITLNDVDAGASTLELSLSTSDGILSLASESGITVVAGANNSNLIVLRGPLDKLNTAINGLKLVSPADLNGTIMVNASLNDLGNSGTGGVKQSSANISVDVRPLNDAPVINVAALVDGMEDSTFIFSDSQKSNQLSLSDADGNVTMQVTLSTSQGLVSLSRINGLSFTFGDGVKDTQIRFTGNLLDINAALNGLSFDPNVNFTGDATITINASDLGGIGSGGIKADQKVATLRIQSVNDLPVVQANSSLSAPVGNTLTLGADKLLALDIESGAQQIIYTLDNELGTAQLMLRDIVLHAGDTFTQEDVNLGALRLLAKNSGTETLQLSVRDHDGGAGEAVRIALDIKPQAVAGAGTSSSPISTNTSISATISNINKDAVKAIADPVSGTVSTLPGAPAVIAPVAETAAGQEKELARSAPNAVNLASNTARPSGNSELQSVNRIDVSRLSIEVPMLHGPIAEVPSVLSTLATASAETPTAFDTARRTESLYDGINLPTSPLSLEKMVADNSFQKNLAQVRDDVMQISAIDRSVVASTIGVSASFTIGYMLWLVRGGVLISSLLASLPAWRMVDPLPVLGTLANGKRGHEDDKSLEELVEHK